MPSLSINNVPEEIMERRRERARGHRRSVQGELLAILEEAAAPTTLSLDQVRRRVAELGTSTGDQSTTWIRELRDAR